MQSGTETTVVLTGYGEWQYLGPAEALWTASVVTWDHARYTVTTDADPASAAGRTGLALDTYEILQGGDGEAGSHYHICGRPGSRVVLVGGA